MAALGLMGVLGTPGSLAACGESGVQLQVLGSGGPEITDGRASASYLLWVDGKARLLIDAGGGSALNFEHSGADFNDVRAVLFSHLHVDHSADLPVYIKGAYFTDRNTDLDLWGPDRNRLMPDVAGFAQALFNADRGAYRYLSEYLDPQRPAGYRISTHTIGTRSRDIRPGYRDAQFITSAVPVHHGPIPALAWRVRVGGKVLVFSGDMNGDYDTLPGLARGADILVAHNAIPEAAGGVARALHMPPSVIGRIAAAARVGKLVLSHRMQRTLGREDETRRIIRRYYKGPILFANDLDCFVP